MINFLFLESNFNAILLNISFLVWIAVIYALFVSDSDEKILLKKIVLGLIFSFFSIMIIYISFELVEGYFFDSRTVFLSLVGLYLGFVPTMIVVVSTMIFRLSMGSDGLYLGLTLILLSSGFGLLWRYYIAKKLKINIIFQLIIFSFVAGLLPFLLLTVSNFNVFQPHFGFLALFYLILLPLVTFGLSLILRKQKKIAYLTDSLKKQAELVKVAIDSPKIMEIFVLDCYYQYLLFNSYHHSCMKEFYGVDIKVGDSFLNYIRDSEMYLRYRSYIFRALQGVEYTTVDEVETTRGKYYESMFTPVLDSKNMVIGAAVFSHDVTVRKNYEFSLKHLNNHDALTNVYNRHFYNENIIIYDSVENYPLCLILADVNSLKTINDAFGHITGDAVLIEAAKTLKEIVGNLGVVSRIGGDEFVILMKNTSNQLAESIIKEINTTLEKKTVSGVKLSMAIGYSIVNEPGKMNEAFIEAEDIMYKNKLFEQATDKNDTINTIMNSLYEKNPREESHSQRVSKYCEMIGESLGLSKDRINSLKVAGVLHDIGKIAINDTILDKPGKLTDLEYEQIKKHTEIGYRILSNSSQYRDISKDILHHHEHYDGRGYPRGLKGEDIPLNSRIIAVADAYDAMTLSRPYRATITKQEAFKELKRCSGTQFDSIIVDAFIKAIQD